MEVPGITVTAPVLSETVNQEFFIEALGGPSNPQTYLEGFFPEAIYTHDLNSNLVALLYALLGPAGIGWIRQNHLLARLLTEGAGLSTLDLDSLYANPFAFARLASESYEFIPQGLLTKEEWEKIQIADASYRNRAKDFLKAVRAGGTLLGIELAAKSGLNRPVDVIENYRALYDAYSDSPLGLKYYGSTRSTEEVIILPRQNVPTSSLQTLVFAGEPKSGEFALQVPIGTEEWTKNIALIENESKEFIATEVHLPWNATANEVQTQLEKLKSVGSNNVIVRGGPAPNESFHISFTNELADQSIPEILVDTSTYKLENEGVEAIAIVTIDQVGATADGQTEEISSEDWHYAYKAIGEIKPMTAIITPARGEGTTQRQIANNVHTDSNFIEVQRYVTGLNNVQWPLTGSTHWIRGGEEIEAPIPQHAERHHYVNFHNVQSIISYGDKAIEDPNYLTNEWPNVNGQYRNEHVGAFSVYEAALFPFLEDFTNPKQRYTPNLGLANPVEPLTVQSVNGELINLLNDTYPTDYQSLPGVKQVPTTTLFWSSHEKKEGSDYLEIDLGTIQVVNYISFQATNKPYNIAVSFDTLDAAPSRHFIPVTLLDEKIIPSNSILRYGSSINPWRSCFINFSDSLGNPIFTRFVRIEFKRRPESPYRLADSTPIPYGVEVRNLRLGRNIV